MSTFKALREGDRVIIPEGYGYHDKHGYYIKVKEGAKGVVISAPTDQNNFGRMVVRLDVSVSHPIITWPAVKEIGISAFLCKKLKFETFLTRIFR